jgi:membrane protein DedA with SNARE-associated domain
MRPELEHLLHEYGYAGIFAIIALENLGLLLPGETILITSAIFAATTHELNALDIVLTAAVASLVGSIAGFMIGRYGERHFLHRFGHYLHLDERDLRLGRYLFQRFGGRVVFVARFIAFLRSLAGLLAGANAMPLKQFLIASGLGALAWSATFGFGAYALGREIEVLSARAGVVVGALVLVAVIAGLRFLRRNRARLQIEADRAAGATGPS